MQRTVIRVLAILGVLVCLFGLGLSQITLSKGWGPGKRSIYDDPKGTIKSMIAIYHAMGSELKRLMVAYETRGMSAIGQLGDQPTSY